MIRNIATVLRGAVLAQVLGLLVLPLLTRLYSPTDFGHFQLYQSAMLLLVVFVSLRFEVALMRAKAGLELRATLALCLISTTGVALVMTICATALFAIFPEFYAQFPVSPLLVGLAVCLIGTFQFLGFLVLREQMYSVSANSKVTQSLSYAGVASILGAFGASLGLIIGDALARLGGTLYLLRKMRGRGLLTMRGVTLAEMKSTAWKFREFPLITVMGGVINSLGAILTPVMIYAKFSPELAGQFALVERSLSFPIAIVVGAVSQVYTGTFSKLIRENPSQIREHFHSLLRMLALVAVVPAIIAFFAAPAVFTTVFGAEWELAGRLAQIMVPAYLAVFVYGGVNMTIMLLGRQWMQTAWEVLRLVLMLLLWGALVDKSTPVEEVVKMHAIVLGGTSVIFIAMAEYCIRRGPTKTALGNK